MKRIGFLITAMAMCCTISLRAQDAATEERLNKLNGQIEDLRAANESLRKHIDALIKEIESVREQAGKPTPNYATQESLKALADAIKEVDRKRVKDGEEVRSELLNIRKAVLSQPGLNRKPPAPQASDNSVPDKPQNGFEYVVQKGDYFSTIVQACREQKKLKVTAEQILKANPGLNPEKIHPGQKIFIPAT